MNRFIVSLFVLAAGLPALLPAADQANGSVRVESSRGLKLAVVNADRHNPANDQLHQTFAESLSFEISQRCKTLMPVKVTVRNAQEASFGLGEGSCDLVVVIGSNVPAALINSDFQILRAQPASGSVKRYVSLIFRAEDAGLVNILQQSFPDALKGDFFQKALMRYSGETGEKEKTDWKIATK